MFAYLVLNPRLPHRREKLADLLYPDAPFERVSRNFSDTLYRLQKALGSNWLAIDRNSVALRLDEHLWVDVWEFERLAASDQEDDIQRAVGLYPGDLLPELYDDWLTSERELRRNLYLSALEKLAALLEERGDFRQALLTLRRLVLAEPLHEPAHQSYLRLLGRMQRYGEALAHYEYLRKLLRSELDSEPLAETRSIAETIENERYLGTVRTETDERTPFVGREAERAALLAAVEAMLKGQGGIIAIEGEAGIGKSRLLREVSAGIHWRGATLLQGVANQTPSTSPFSPLAEALAPLFNGPRGVQLETSLKGEILAALAPINTAWANKATLVDVPPDLAIQRFYDALRSLGETLARLAPTILAIDDLQWAETALWKSLDVLAQSMVQSGALMVVLYRRPGVEPTPGWEVIQAWDRAGLLKMIPLQSLSIEEVAQLVIDRKLFNPIEVHAGTGGNPFYIHQWLLAPETSELDLQNSITHRLQTLSSPARMALEGASILGENVPYRLWTELSDLPSIALAGLGDELVMQHWLQPTASGYAFTHDLVRTAVYTAIEPELRRHLHERTALIYQVNEPGNVSAQAFHLDRAGHQQAAAQAYRKAGELYMACHAFGEAQTAFERALSLMTDEPTVERVEANILLANLCDLTGNANRFRAALAEAQAGAERLQNKDLLFQAHLAAGRLATETGIVERAQMHLNAALDLARQMVDQEKEAITIFRLVVLEAHQGHYQEGLELARQGLRHALAAKARYVEGQLSRATGILYARLEQPQKAIRWVEQSMKIFRELGEQYQTLLSAGNLNLPYVQLGMWEDYVRNTEENTAFYEASGARNDAERTRGDTAIGYFMLGNREKARKLYQDVLEHIDSASTQRLGIVKINLAIVEEADLDFEKAKQLFNEAIDLFETSQSTAFLAFAQNALGAMYIKLDNPHEAIPLLRSAQGYFQKGGLWLQNLYSNALLGLAYLGIGERAKAEALARDGWIAFRDGVSFGQSYIQWLWAFYRLMLALDQESSANELIHAAYADLQRQAQYIHNPENRRNFFENVHTNRLVVEAYDRLKGTLRNASVSLAHRDAPLGRQLREDEYITVQWSVSAPEDEAIADKTERRQHRLKRLLMQAESQNAAPTDGDLAQALGVSRRTILRDMQALAQEVPRPPTRKRKA